MAKVLPDFISTRRKPLFNLSWEPIFCDVIYDRTLNKTVNSWIILITLVTLAYIYLNDSGDGSLNEQVRKIKFRTQEEADYLTAPVKLLVYSAVGFCLSFIMLGPMLLNSQSKSRTISTKVMIVICSASSITVLYLIWADFFDSLSDTMRNNTAKSAGLDWYPIVLTFLIIAKMLFAMVLYVLHPPYVEDRVSKNITHVRCLLAGKKEVDNVGKDFWRIRDMITVNEHECLQLSGYTSLDVITKFKWKYVVWDIYYHTPPIILIAVFLCLAFSMFYSCLLDSFVIFRMTADDIVDYFEKMAIAQAIAEMEAATASGVPSFAPTNSPAGVSTSFWPLAMAVMHNMGFTNNMGNIYDTVQTAVPTAVPTESPTEFTSHPLY